MKRKFLVYVGIFMTLMISLPVLAESGDYKIEALIEKNFISGYEDKSLRLDKTITRAEFTKMIVEVKGDGYFADKLKDEDSIFKDVNSKHWANGYINIAEKNGYINGYGDKTFKPQKVITNREAIAIIARLHPDFTKTNSYRDDWFEGYLDFAKSHGILNDLHIDEALGEGTTRKIAFHLIYNIDVEIDSIIEEIVENAMKSSEEKEVKPNNTYNFKSESSGDKWHKNRVRFYDGEKLISTKYFKDGELLKFPDAPVKDGYNFVDWYMNGKKVDSSYRVRDDLILVAKYEKKANDEDGKEINYMYAIKELQNLLKEDLTESENIDKVDKEIFKNYRDSLYYARGLLDQIGDGKKVELNTIESATNRLSIATEKLKTELERLNSKTEVSVESIRTNSKDHKKVYEVGESLDTRGLTIEVKNSDGSEKTVEVIDEMVEGFDSEKPQKSQTLTITYEGKTTTYDVEIVEKKSDAEIVWIKVNSEDYKKVYKIGDRLDTKNLKILIKRDDYTLEEVDVTPDMVEGFDSTKSTNLNRLTINYEDKSVTYDIKILGEKNSDMPKLESLEIGGKAFDDFDPNILNYVVETDEKNVPFISVVSEDEENIEKKVNYALDFKENNVSTVTLTSKDGTKNLYTVTFIKKPKIITSDNRYLKSIKVGDKIIEARHDKNTYKVYLKKGEEMPEVDAIPEDFRNRVKINREKDRVIIDLISENDVLLRGFSVNFYYVD